MGYETNGNGWPTPITKGERERRKYIDKAWSEALAKIPADKSARELQAENETLRAHNAELVRALEACITERGAYAMHHDENHRLVRRITAINETARAILAKVQA